MAAAWLSGRLLPSGSGWMDDALRDHPDRGFLHADGRSLGAMGRGATGLCERAQTP